MQQSFKLLEFNVYDDELYNEEDSKKYIDNKQFLVQMFGLNEQGKTVAILVTGFKPFFYIKVDNNWNEEMKQKFTNSIRNELGNYYKDALISTTFVSRKKLDKFDGEKYHKFICLKFKSTAAFNKAKKLWYTDTYKNGGWVSRKVSEEGYIFLTEDENMDGQTFIYESNIPTLLRLFHIKEISPSGWIQLPLKKSTKIKSKTTSCDYEYLIDYKYIIPLPNKENVVPYKMVSFDIEASSSHGDFPLAKKDYKKLAIDIVDVWENNEKLRNKEGLEKMILTAFDYQSIKDINIVYPKKDITRSEIIQKFKKWIEIKPALESFSGFILDNQEESSESEGDETNDVNCEESVNNYKKKSYIKNYQNKEGNIIDLLHDTCGRDTKIKELTKTLSKKGLFPELKGDKVTFIGSTFKRFGEKEEYLNHIIVLKGCTLPEGVKFSCVESYNTEKEVLLGWTKLIQRENPDVIIGYNITGFDFDFMDKRAQELGCRNEFLQLGRNLNKACLTKDWRTNREDIESNKIKLASGEYELRYINMVGRLQIDLLNYLRREFQLSCYKLDYISGYFIGDSVKKVEISDNITKIYTKNIKGLDEGSYVRFQEVSFSVNPYKGGKKFNIISINKEEGYFTINGKEELNIEKKITWGLAKDDVGPQEIFKLTNGSDLDRGIIAKYCLKDCKNTLDVLEKIDVITFYAEMASLCTVPMNYLVNRGQGIKLQSYLAKKCREKQVLMPVLEKSEDDEGYEGAIVLEPNRNLYLKNPIGVCDYSSLYPSCMISENISHDSKVWTKEFDLQGNLLKITGEQDGEDNFKYDNLLNYKYVDITFDTFQWQRKTPKAAQTKVKVGYKICRFAQFPEGKGVLPSILEELLAARKSTRKQIPLQKDDFMKNILDKRQLAIKITANSLYGGTGAKTSAFFEKDVAACTTAMGRTLLIYAKTVIEEYYKNRVVTLKDGKEVLTNAEIVYGDSVAGNTPIYIRINKEKIDICTIEELANKYGNNKWMKCQEDGKEDKLVCELENIENWSEIGWTKCNRIIKHRLAPEKKMLRILTHTGMVDVTDDHSLVKNTGEMISPKDVEIGTKLLHKTMEINNVNTNISIDEAKIMGFFFGDGSCGTYNCKCRIQSSWALNNSDSNLLNKYLNLCKEVYPEFTWKIYDTIKSSGVNKLTFTVKNRGDKLKFIKRYREELYYNNSKKIPDNILNSNKEIREAFWEGLYDADGDKDKNGYTRIDQKSQLSASHICWLANSIGYKTSINIRNDKQNIYRITATKNYQRKDPDIVKKIVELDIDTLNTSFKECNHFYVYDLTTENHHFAAGIGNMIVHNTDSIFFNFNLKEVDGKTEILGKEALKSTIEISQYAGKLATKFLKKPHDLEYEKTFYPFCLLSKKRYVGMLYEFDIEFAKLKSMGLVLKRRDNADIVKDIYGEVINILMKGGTVSTAIKYVRECMENVIDEKYPIEKLTVTKSLRSNYKNPKQIAHKVLADRIGERDYGNKPKPGDRIGYVYFKNTNKKCLQGDKIELPNFIKEHNLDIDYSHYITNQIMKPLQQLFALVLEQIKEFRDIYGYTCHKWKSQLKKLEDKWEDREKLYKKVEELRCKEIKKLIFDDYLNKLK